MIYSLIIVHNLSLKTAELVMGEELFNEASLKVRNCFLEIVCFGLLYEEGKRHLMMIKIVERIMSTCCPKIDFLLSLPKTV